MTDITYAWDLWFSNLHKDGIRSCIISQGSYTMTNQEIDSFTTVHHFDSAIAVTRCVQVMRWILV